MAYEVNVSISCQFEDTDWDYLDEPVYTEWFDNLGDAEDAYFDMGGIDKDAIAAKFHEKYPECKAFEAETSITEDGCDFGVADGCEYFDNERIWTEEGWEW